MKRYIKNLIKEFIPPFFMKIYANQMRPIYFHGNFSNWEEALKYSDGYGSDKIVEKVKESLLKIQRGEAVYERDSVLFNRIEYYWYLLAILLWVASCNDNKLNLVDFGGSLGTTYFQNRKFLMHLQELRWNIIEQEKFVEFGKRYFENNSVKFYYNLDDYIKEQEPHAILFSSSIQYISEPYRVLKKVINMGFKYIIFDRTAFLINGEDRLTVQKISSKIYDASYPAWFFNEDKFKKLLLDKFELIIEFDNIDKANIKSKYKGFVFKRFGDV